MDSKLVAEPVLGYDAAQGIAAEGRAAPCLMGDGRGGFCKGAKDPAAHSVDGAAGNHGRRQATRSGKPGAAAKNVLWRLRHAPERENKARINSA